MAQGGDVDRVRAAAQRGRHQASQGQPRRAQEVQQVSWEMSSYAMCHVVMLHDAHM